jgi:ubiquinone/menaquinone biosynthesis C-methylase UbiE
MATAAWTAPCRAFARARAPASRRRDLRARASAPFDPSGSDEAKRDAVDVGSRPPSPRLASRRDACLGVALTAAVAAPGTARASDTADISRAYDRYAKTYDVLDGSAFAGETLGLDKTRRDVLSKAKGTVLELGVGTGLNLSGYDYERVASLTAVDISEGMLLEAKARVERSLDVTLNDGTRVKDKIAFEVADAERLPFESGRFDCVVDTFSLCVMRDPEAALREIKRVLKPDGVALLVEHTRSAQSPVLGLYQDLVNAPVTKMSKGCAWNQDVERMATGAGFVVTRSEPSVLGLITTLEARPK